MRRRAFISLLGGAAAWPLAARAQQPAMLTVGFVWGGAQAPAVHLIALVRQSLAEAGYVEGRNLTIEYRFAEGNYDRLPSMATELVGRRVALIVCIPTPAALAAKAATATIPIVFGVPDDPVKYGLVASIARPGGNATGVSFLLGDLGAKQLGLLRELVPTASRFGFLVNPNNENAETITSNMKVAAGRIGVEIITVRARDGREIEAAFAALVAKLTHSWLVLTFSFFSRRLQIATLATRHALPAVYNAREYAEAGGLMSYGTNLAEVYRQVGAYLPAAS